MDNRKYEWSLDSESYQLDLQIQISMHVKNIDFAFYNFFHHLPPCMAEAKSLTTHLLGKVIQHITYTFIVTDRKKNYI